MPDEFDPLTGDPMPKTSAGNITPADDRLEISPTTLTRLDSMTKEELVALIERMSRQCGLVANMSKEETAQAMLDVLANTALREIFPGVNMRADIQSRMAAIDKWLDRERGKPAQMVQANVVHMTLGELVEKSMKVIDNNH